MVTAPEYLTSRQARSPFSPSGSTPCPRRRRPGTASSGSTAGGVPGCACIRQSRRWDCARPDPTRCGTSTPPSSAWPKEHAPICTGHRQLLPTDSGVARGRHVPTGQQRGRAARGQSGATRSASAPVVLADAGVANVNARVDELIATGVLRRLLAFTELQFSNRRRAARGGRQTRIRIVHYCSQSGEGCGANSLKRLAPQAGLEPATLRLTAGCSAIELLRNARATVQSRSERLVEP